MPIVRHEEPSPVVSPKHMPEAIKCIVVWVDKLKARGFSDDDSSSKIVVHGDGPTIIEIFRGDEYMRIVADPGASAHKPFEFWRYKSIEHCERPKTEYHMDQTPPKHLDSLEISAQLVEFLI